jgi:hypothetical protein
MVEPDFRSASRDIEEHLVVPDFDPVARRGHMIRRRRRAVRIGAAAAGVVAVAGALGALQLSGTGPDDGPATPPPDDQVVALLRDPAATVDGTATRLSDSGAVLHRVVVPSPVGGRCDADRRTAFVLVDPAGEVEAWNEDVVGRSFTEVPGGFVVGAPDASCRAVVPDETAGGAYVVTADGARREVDWAAGAEQVCAVDPASLRCEVDVETATGRLVPPGELRNVPNGSAEPVSRDGDDVWARSVDARTLYWSSDGGRSWRSHETTLDGPNLQVAAAGDRGVFVDWPTAEVTSDQGRSWSRVELGDVPDRFTVPDLGVVVTPDGGLVLVSRPVGGPPLVLAATDESWQELTPVDLRTEVGGVQVERSGNWLFVPDLERGWRSADGGLTWELVDPLR